MDRKELIKKIVLIVISLVIVAFIIVNNFIGGSGRKSIENFNSQGINEGEAITYGETARFLSFLFYNRSEMNEIEKHSNSIYLNALREEGVIESGDLKKNLEDKLTCGKFRDMLWEIVDLLDLNYREISRQLPERLSQVTEEDYLLSDEFFTVYQAMINQLNEQHKVRFETKKLYILSENITDQVGIYQAQDQITYYTDINYLSFHNDQYVEVLTCENEILMQMQEIHEPVVLHNVYLLEGQDMTVDAYICTVERKFKTKRPMSDQFKKVVGDLTIQDGTVIGISIKPEIIQGKVLVSGENEIEIEGYGMLPLHEDYRIYKVYGNLAMEKTNNILVGYSVTDFVVSEGKVCAALIKEKVIADNIRVLINTTGYQSLYHKSVTFTSEDAFIINDGKHKVEFPAGEEVTVSAGCKLLQNGRIKVESTAEEGKIALTSISRNYGIPKYRGSIEIAETEKGLTVVNELSIEEYLYSVVPSEMPTSYGSEALKVQAVCARSYAFKQLMANKYSAYGAHVDDSVNCQVYNNVEENEESILSVKDTYGQVLTADGNVITAYYFSTSCGTTANVEDVWEDSAASSYLTGTLQTEEKIHVDLSGEQQFRDFISQDLVNVTVGNKSTLKKMDTFDSGFLMYRWNVTFDIETLSKQINKLLASQYNTSTSSILTYVGKATDEEVAVADYKNRRIVNDLVFANKPIKSIGTVREIYVTQRGSSGIVKELIVIGTEKTILLRYQGNIRSFFAPKDAEVTRLDGSVIRGMSLLPSAFCIFDPIMNDGKLSAYRITGGGFGHGVGMSQNGVKTMTKLGMTYEQILSHYYTDSSITVIYDK